MSNFNRLVAQQQRYLANQVKKTDVKQFFNLLTGPELQELVEAQLPEHRQSKYPPTLTLSMFLGQVMSADSSCQKAVNEANVNRLLSEQLPASSHTGATVFKVKRS